MIGIGLNIGLSAKQAVDIGQPWSALNEDYPHLGRNYLAARIIDELSDALSEFVQNGWAAFADEWCDVDVLVGRTLELVLPGKVESGIGRGVDAQGNLLLEREGEIGAFGYGEVSVRLQGRTG